MVSSLLASLQSFLSFQKGPGDSGSPRWWEKSKYYSHLQNRQKRWFVKRQTSQPHFSSWEKIWVLIEALSGLIKDKKVTRKKQQSFIKGKLCPIVLYYETAWLMKDGSSLDIIYLKFSRAFDMVSHNILVDSLVRHGSDKGHKLQELSRLLSSKLVANGSN